MIRIVADGGKHELHREALIRLLDQEVGQVRIASAYVGHQEVVTVRARETRLMFSLATQDIVCGATSLDALSLFVSSGVDCRYVSGSPKLHAKVYIFGSRVGLITSANLTHPGLTSNIEVGIEIRDQTVKTLVEWYDRLWRERAEPLTMKLIARLRQETRAIRDEFRALQNKWRVASESTLKSPLLNRDYARLPDKLRELFAAGQRFFICNTNRRDRRYTQSGSFLFEELMHERGFAAAWEAFDYPKRMEEVQRGNIIMMFAKGVGIIGIGKAEDRCKTIPPGDSNRIYESDYMEWRVPVTWLAWRDDEDAFPWSESPNKTFFDVSGETYVNFRRGVLDHFFAD